VRNHRRKRSKKIQNSKFNIWIWWATYNGGGGKGTAIICVSKNFWGKLGKIRTTYNDDYYLLTAVIWYNDGWFIPTAIIYPVYPFPNSLSLSFFMLLPLRAALSSTVPTRFFAISTSIVAHFASTSHFFHQGDLVLHFHRSFSIQGPFLFCVSLLGFVWTKNSFIFTSFDVLLNLCWIFIVLQVLIWLCLLI